MFFFVVVTEGDNNDRKDGQQIGQCDTTDCIYWQLVGEWFCDDHHEADGFSEDEYQKHEWYQKYQAVNNGGHDELYDGIVFHCGELLLIRFICLCSGLCFSCYMVRG